MIRPYRIALIALSVLVMVASWWTSDLGQTSGRNALPSANKVLIFGVPNLDLSDVQASEMPNLYRLSQRGVIGAIRVKTGGVRPVAAEAYASLGAGMILATGSAGSLALDATESQNGLSARQNQMIRTGEQVEGKVLVPGIVAIEQHHGVDQGIGGLGTTLAAAGKTAGVVANASMRGTDNRLMPSAPAALALADRNGVVQGGTVGESLLQNDPASPFGLRVSRAKFGSAVSAALTKASVVVVDPGETARAAAYRTFQTSSERNATRQRALARTDLIISDVAGHLPSRTLMMVIGITPSSSPFGMTPMIVYGNGVGPGILASPSTHRSGIATITDLAPTILSVLGVKQPPPMQGSALRVNPGPSNWAGLAHLDTMLTARSTALPAMRMVFIVAQVFIFVGALVLLRYRRPDRRGQRVVEVLALSCAAWPLATFFLRFTAATSSLGFVAIPVSWAISIVLALAAQRFQRSALDPLLVICGATLALLVLDLATGGHLVLGSYFGSAPNVGFRFFGTDNAVFAILATCAILVCCGLCDRARDQLWLVGTIALVAVLVDGAPWMGADVGGVLTLVPVLAVMVWALAGQALKWRYLIVAFAASAVTLAIAIAVDAARPATSRTHIGRFFLETGHGDHALLTSTIAQKWNDSMAVLWQSNWSWAIPIVAVYALYVLVVPKAWTALLPMDSPRRVGVIAALVLGIAGWLLNDSGILVTALVFVYLGPMLILLDVRDGPRTQSHSELEVV